MSDQAKKAHRTCALICWQHRDQLKLTPAEIEQTLIAWMEVGDAAEAEAATEVLAARRATEAKQLDFDAVLRRER